MDPHQAVEALTLLGMLAVVVGHFFTAKAELKQLRAAVEDLSSALKEVLRDIKPIPVLEARLSRTEAVLEAIQDEVIEHGEAIAALGAKQERN